MLTSYSTTLTDKLHENVGRRTSQSALIKKNRNKKNTFTKYRPIGLPISAVSGPKFAIFWGHVEEVLLFNKFLANVNSCSRSLYAIARPSVVCLSVTLVRPTQAVQIFGNISTALGTLAIHWHPLKLLRRSSQGNPSAGGVKNKRGSQI